MGSSIFPPLPRRSGRAREQHGVCAGRRRCSSGSCGAEPARLVTPKCAASSSPFPEPSSSKSKPSSTLCQRFKITRSHFSMERRFIFFCVEAPPWQPCKAPGSLFQPVQNTTLRFFFLSASQKALQVFPGRQSQAQPLTAPSSPV